eukprot:2312630-Rhodomonas_salina.2
MQHARKSRESQRLGRNSLMMLREEQSTKFGRKARQTRAAAEHFLVELGLCKPSTHVAGNRA